MQLVPEHLRPTLYVFLESGVTASVIGKWKILKFASYKNLTLQVDLFEFGGCIFMLNCPYLVDVAFIDKRTFIYDGFQLW